jgi:hypothetical protein
MPDGRKYANVPLVTLDSLWGAVGFLSREWGDYGYRIGIHAGDGRGGAVYAVGRLYADGSEFFIEADRYGNARESEGGNDA